MHERKPNEDNIKLYLNEEVVQTFNQALVS